MGGRDEGESGLQRLFKEGSAAANTAHPPQSSPSIIYGIWLAD